MVISFYFKQKIFKFGLFKNIDYLRFMDLAALKSHCQDLAFKGKDYLEIERAIRTLDITEKDREAVLKQVDSYIVHYEISQQEQQKHLYKLMIGFLLLFIGGGALLTSVGQKGVARIFAVVFVLYGAWMARGAYAAYRKPLRSDFGKERKFKSGDMRKFYDR